MESMQAAPTKTALKRRFESNASGSREQIESIPDFQVSEPEVSEQFDDTSSVCDSSISTAASDNLESDVALKRLQIKTGLQAMNLSMVEAIKKRDFLRAAIARKKEEIRENNERTAEIRRKNEEISMMIQTEDKEMSALCAKMKKESTTLQFYQTQVISAREQIQKSKREMNKNKIMQAENVKLVTAGIEEVNQLKQEIDTLVTAKEEECRALEEKLKAIGDPDEIYATLLSLREQLASQRQEMENTDSTRDALKAQRKQAAKEYRDIKDKYEERVEYKRSLKQAHHNRMESHQKELESKRSILADLERQTVYKKQMVALETDHMNRMKKTLTDHEMDRDKMRESSKTFEQKYAQLKEDVARLKRREEEVTEEVDNKTNELNQATYNLNHRQEVVQQKQNELEQRKTKVVALKQTLAEKNARKEEIERAIMEKKTIAHAKLADAINKIDENCERDMKTMDEQLAENKSVLEKKIEWVQRTIAKNKEDQETFILNHVTAVETHTAKITHWTEKRNEAQKQLAEFQQTKVLLQEKQKRQREYYAQQLELKRIELEEKLKEVERNEERRRKEMEEKQAKKDEAEDKRAEAKEKCKAVLKEKEETKSLVNQKIDQLEQVKLIEKEQEEKISKLRRQIEETETEQQNARSRIEALKSEINETRNKCSNLTATIDEITTGNEIVLEDISQLRTKMEQMDKEEAEYETEIKQLDDTLETMELRHEQEKQESREAHEAIMGELTSKKEMQRTIFRAQYEKLTLEYENTLKATNEATDELRTLKSEREKKVASLQDLIKEKENLDKEYKKNQEYMVKMQNLLANMQTTD
uniref:Uncharacterized protein n=1 Tax=Cacopsylla melanoneura TaxID=428564 RepID=A0A8D8Z4R0_9HEMI